MPVNSEFRKRLGVKERGKERKKEEEGRGGVREEGKWESRKARGRKRKSKGGRE